MGYNKTILHGGQLCDYLYIQKGELDEKSFLTVDSEPTEWNNNTVLFSAFNGDLVAGNSAIVGEIDGYEIRRKNIKEDYTEYIATIEKGTNRFFIDYSAKEGAKYIYYLYPSANISDVGVFLSPLFSKEISGEWDYYSLLVVEETKRDNLFYLDKLFKFELNVETGEMNNNTDITVIKNFTKYPIVQSSPSNYWSGSLTALCGFINCRDTDYIQTPNMIEELKNLTTCGKKMFLKDLDGNFFEVKVSAPILISTEDKCKERPKTITLNWVEVGDTKGVSVINNPNKPTIEWVLTDDGDAASYINYVWNENNTWTEDLYWTENKVDNIIGNMGREVTEGGMING